MITVQQKVQEFFSAFPSHSYKKGDTIIHPGTTLQGVYYLHQGNVRTYAISKEGSDLTIHLFKPGAFFPLMYIIAENVNTYYYEAINDVTLHIAPKDAVIHFLQSNSDVLFDLTSRLLIGMDKLTHRLELVTFSHATKRIISALLLLARHFGTEQNNMVTINEEFTHKTIATIAGMSRETASRILEDLQKKQLISTEKHLIRILDISTLEQMLTAD